MARYLQSAFRVGDLVEVQTFGGALLLASVRREPEAGADDARLGVTFADGKWGDVPLFTLRWHLPNAAGRIASLREESARVLQKHAAKLRKAVLLHDSLDALSRHRLLYEGDVVRRVFGARAGPAEQYATHAWFWLQSAHIGRDSAFGLCPERGAGPYYVRREATRDGMNHIGIDSGSKVLAKAAMSDWNDSLGNPYLKRASESSLAAGGAPIESREDAVMALYKMDLSALDNVDIPRERSGLDYSSAVETEVNAIDSMNLPNHTAPHNQMYYVASHESVGGKVALAIDAAHTVEVDDAVSISRDSTGRTVLHVHVADAAAAAPRFSQPYDQALERVSSLYCADTTFRMMPADVSARASLGEGRDNQAITFSAVLSESGDIVESSVAIGKSPPIVRLTPEAVDGIISKSDDISTDVATAVNRIQKLAADHASFRALNGAYSLNIPRMRASRDASTGNLSLHSDAETPARSMVAECMIIGGRVAARWATDNGIAAPFRSHDSIPGFMCPPRGSTIADVLQAASHLQPSRLTATSAPHAALGLAAYIRATSPLRRAPDLVLHAQIRARLLRLQAGRTYSHAAMAALLPGLETHEQYLRRLALASNRFWTMRYMEQQLRRSSGKPLESVAHLVKRTTRGATVFLEAFGLTLYSADVPQSIVGGSSFSAHIPYVDAVRQVVDVRPEGG